MRNMIVILFTSGLVACSFFAEFYDRGYFLNAPNTVTVGSTMMYWTIGYKNKNNGEILRSLTKELIYTGTSQNVIRIMYREYNTGYAKPAYYQELTYDKAVSTNIAFQDVRITIHSSDQEKILFTVTKAPDIDYDFESRHRNDEGQQKLRIE